MCQPDRWEHGSDFHLLEGDDSSGEQMPWDGNGLAFGSGRDALGALLEHGSAKRGWRRLWMPSYFCPDVVPAIVNSGIAVEAYPDSPTDARAELERIRARAGDVILRVNFLGLRHLGAPHSALPPGVEVIDDHTHDPWSSSARSHVADWCIASLRKTLPLPDGGILWSPAGYPLPDGAPETREHRLVALEKLAAMALKASYIDGGNIEKPAFRALYEAGEARIGDGAISGMSPWSKSMTRRFPVTRWRGLRRENHRILAEALVGVCGVSVLQADAESDTCPFSVTLVCDTAEHRTAIRQRLIDDRVYPAILWPLEDSPLEGTRESDIELSCRILCLHCDMRYSAGDMLRVAKLVRTAAQLYASSQR